MSTNCDYCGRHSDALPITSCGRKIQCPGVNHFTCDLCLGHGYFYMDGRIVRCDECNACGTGYCDDDSATVAFVDELCSHKPYALRTLAAVLSTWDVQEAQS